MVMVLLGCEVANNVFFPNPIRTIHFGGGHVTGTVCLIAHRVGDHDVSSAGIRVGGGNDEPATLAASCSVAGHPPFDLVWFIYIHGFYISKFQTT
jgi:hypothetical protein